MTLKALRARAHARACVLALAAASVVTPSLAADRWLSIDKVKGQGVYVWDNGMRYEGGHVQGKRQGEGVLTWANGDRYEGQFADNRMLRGRIAYANGRVYEGGFDALGRASGPGVSVMPNGERYEGNHLEGRLQGTGRYVFSNGAVFQGEFDAGQIFLRGVRTTSDGQRTEVDVAAVAEKRSGLGITVDISGNRYEGSFVNGQRQGRGKLLAADGVVSEGDFVAGLMQRGVRRYANGQSYEGSFNAKGQREGQGSYLWPSGQRYDGGWLADDQHGPGRMKTGDAVFEGTYAAGKAVKGTRVEADGKRVEIDLEAVLSKKTGTFVSTDGAGNRYEGSHVDGKRQGSGKLTFVNGQTAEGEFANDLLLSGKRVLGGGLVYEGAFDAQGRYAGQGVFSWPSGQRYEGAWVDGQQQGAGRLRYADGDIFEGQFFAGSTARGVLAKVDGKRLDIDMSAVAEKRTGPGITLDVAGNRYDGDFVDGKRQGRGSLVLAGGTRYEGDFVGDRLVRGRYTATNGHTYEGEYDDQRRRTGRGVYTFPSGTRYEGEFLAGQYSGQGLLVWASGARYEGDFLLDKRSGRGKQLEANGARYEGDFVDDLRDGQGVETDAEGGRYEGGFLKGKRSGIGKFAGPKHSYEGGWLEGQMSGRGLYRFSDGSTYEGEMARGNFNGYGVRVYADGDRYAGQWVDDKRQGQTEQQARSASSSSDSSGQLIAGFIGSAIIGSARGIASADKVRLIGGFVQDVATDGKAGGIAAATNDMRAARAQSAAVQQAMAEQQQRAAEQERARAAAAQERARAEQERRQAQVQAQAQAQTRVMAQAAGSTPARPPVASASLSAAPGSAAPAARSDGSSVQLAQLATQQRAEQERRDSERQALEATRKREEEQRLAAEASRRKAEEAAARRAQEKADKEAAERARVQVETQAKNDFLAQMRSGTRLRARHCPDGEGEYYVVGLYPKVTPKPMSCLDVHFRAVCPGNAVGSTGVGKNFSGIATDCFMGDAVKIVPKPACKVEDVTVQLTDIRGCGE